MPTLKRARDYYLGQPEFTYNPLWRHIHKSFQRHMLAMEGDSAYETDLYVETRVSNDGVQAGDVDAYLRDDNARLYVIEAPAGLGKTTFLRYLRRSIMTDGRMVTLWIDVLRDVDETSTTSVIQQIKALLAGKLQAAVSSHSGTLLWWKYFLSHAPSQTGSSDVLREELEETGTLARESRLQLARLFEEGRTDFMEMARLRFGFLRAIAEKIPCVIIDNIDQLRTADIKELVIYAKKLAEGPGGPEGDGLQRARVIVAMRPISAGLVTAATAFVTWGILQPPILAEVLQRRLDRFLTTLQGRVLRGRYLVSEESGKEVDVRKLLWLDDESIPVEAAIRDAIKKLAEIMLRPNSSFGVDGFATLLQLMTNYNTRVCLSAMAHYLATGHVDWKRLLEAVAGRRPSTGILSRHKIFMALILGVNSVYSSAESWVWNVFSDGERDSAGVLLRIRLLKLVSQGASGGGLAKKRIHETLGALFSYDKSRVLRTHKNFWHGGLVQEQTPLRFVLTDAGWSYLRLVRNFEYLQHVVIDSCVGNDYLVPCESVQEDAFTRVRRLVEFAAWVRRLEVAELRGIIAGEMLPVYERYFGEDLVCSAIARTVSDSFVHLPRTENLSSAWRELEQRLDHLLASCMFPVVLSEAKESNEALR